MANQFSFAPNPSFGWGGHGMTMGRSLLSALTGGLNVMDAWDRNQRNAATADSWIGAQNAHNDLSMMHDTNLNMWNQNVVNQQLHALGLGPASQTQWDSGIPQSQQLPGPPAVPPVPSPDAMVPHALDMTNLQTAAGQYYSPWMGLY